MVFYRDKLSLPSWKAVLWLKEC